MPPRAVKVNAWERRWKALRRPDGRLSGLRETLNVRCNGFCPRSADREDGEVNGGIDIVNGMVLR